MPTGANESDTTTAPGAFVRELATGEWEVVDGETDERVGDVYATRNAALDAALAELGNPVKAPHLKDENTGTPVGAWRWLDATSEEPESAALDADGNVVRPRITAAAIWEMAASLNASPMPRPIDGGRVPDGFAPSPVHGTAQDSGTPANGWAHAGVPFVTAAGETHLALRGELWPTVATEFDRGRLAYGSVHIEGEDIDETGAIEGATLESHGLTNRPVVQTLLPSTAMLSRGRQAVVTLRARGEGRMKTKVKALRGPAMDAITELCTLLGVDVGAELEGDEWSSLIVERVRALKQLAVGEQAIEALPTGGGEEGAGEAVVAAARAKHIKKLVRLLSEGEEPVEADAATQAVAALQNALGLGTPEEVLAWVSEHTDDLAALAGGALSEEGDEEEEEGTMATKSKGRRGRPNALKLALSRLGAVEAELAQRKDAEIVARVDADMAAGKFATVERADYLELARKDPALYSKLTKNARAVPTGTVAKPSLRRSAGGAVELDPKDLRVRALRAAGLSDANIKARLSAEAEG